MVASQKTIAEILKVVRRHIKDERVLRALLHDLTEVPGTKSFRDTIEQLQHLAARSR